MSIFKVLDIIIEMDKTIRYSEIIIFLTRYTSIKYNFLNIDDFYIFISGKRLGKNGNNSFLKCYNNYLKNKRCLKEKINLFDDSLYIYRIK